MTGSSAGSARWWEARRAQSLKPATYRCPLCDRQLPALSDHILLFPEGDHARRRHAHRDCVLAARRAGTLPTRAEWEAAQPGRRERRGLRWPLPWPLRRLGTPEAQRADQRVQPPR